MRNDHVSKISIQGFKSLRDCEISLRNRNILIGPNASGKSNFLQVFTLIQQILTGRLQFYFERHGGPDALFYRGRQRCRQLRVHLFFEDTGYLFSLVPTDNDFLMFADEYLQTRNDGCFSLGEGQKESSLFFAPNLFGAAVGISETMRSWIPAHYNRNDDNAPIRKLQDIYDCRFLRPDGSNLGAILYYIKEHFPKHYTRIVMTVRLAVPSLQDFVFVPCMEHIDYMTFYWKEKGSGVLLDARQISSGTLRFICLATLLLMPEQLQPPVILLDTPERELHPAAIRILAAMLRTVSHSRQIIFSTNSSSLLSEFDPEDVIVVERTHDGTSLRRLNCHEVRSWLDDYSLGELWEKNILEGIPWT